MLPFQANAQVYSNFDPLHDVMKENSVLLRELGRIQERCTRLIAEKDADIEYLRNELVSQHAIRISKEAQIEYLTKELSAMRALLFRY